MNTNEIPPDEQQWRISHLMETYKGLVTLAVEALKMLAIVNGGAAVALLTYLGNLVSRTLASGLPPPDIAPALRWYCGGLFSTILAFVFAYVTQLTLYNEELRYHPRRSRPRQYHALGIWLSVALALFAAAAFIFGSLDAARTLITAARHVGGSP